MSGAYGGLTLFSSHNGTPTVGSATIINMVPQSVAQLAALQFSLAAQPQLLPRLLRTVDQTVAEAGQFSSRIDPVLAQHGLRFLETVP